MKSPIKHPDSHAICLSHIKNIVPKASTIWSYLFFSGELEFNLSESDRFICAHTDRYVIYEFWQCAMNNVNLICEILNTQQFHDFKNQRIFHILQENWPKYKDAYVRSAMFFMLNRYSETGLISSGTFSESNFNPVAMSHLKKFNPDNFHLEITPPFDSIQIERISPDADFLLFPLGRFNYNLFESGKSKGFEDSSIHHTALFDKLSATDRKWIVLYKMHPNVVSAYDKFNITMVNKYGNKVVNQQDCEELIVTNF
jgi:hypothetical protein